MFSDILFSFLVFALPTLAMAAMLSAASYVLKRLGAV
jgi:hypothetical protein